MIGVTVRAGWMLGALVAVSLTTSWAAAQDSGRAVPDSRTLTGAYLAARHALAVNDLTASADYLRAALARDADNLGILRSALSVSISAGEIEEAVRLAKRVHSAEPRDQLALTTLMLDDIRDGRLESAATRLAALERDGVPRFLLPLVEAWIEAGQGNQSAALEALEVVAAAPGLRPVATLHRALILDAAGDLEGARAAYDSVVDNALTVRGAQIVGSFYERSGDPEAARALYVRVTEEQPGLTLLENAIARLDQGETAPALVDDPASGVAEALFQFASIVSQEGRQDLALIYARFVPYLEPDFELGWLLVGDILSQRTQHKDALAVYRAIDAGGPAGWAARLRMAGQLEALDRADEAIALLNEMAEERPERAAPLVSIGDIERARGRFAEAVAAYDAAAEREPEDAGQGWSFFYKRGIALERSDQWPRAVEDLKRALELNPNHAHLLNYLGYSWIDRGENLAEAEAMVRRAVDMEPQDGYIIDSLGWALFRTGRFAEAVVQLERAVELEPADAVLNDHLGDAYWMVGRRAEARYQWQRALAAAGEDEPELPSLIQEKLISGLEEPDLVDRTLQRSDAAPMTKP